MEAGVNWKLAPAGLVPVVRLGVLKHMQAIGNMTNERNLAATGYTRMRLDDRIAEARLSLDSYLWLAVKCEIDISDLLRSMMGRDLTTYEAFRRSNASR
jgi:hypothetical protein